jgi:hypothetical protein
MKTSSYSVSKVQQNFEKFFDKSSIKKVAKKTAFIKRKPKKVDPYHFVLGLIKCFSKKKNTYSQWAEEITKLSGKKVTKQAAFNRISETTVTFCKDLLQEAISKKAKSLRGSLIFKSFGKVILHDSTTLKLPDCLSAIFPGNCSKGIQKAVARIQSILDLKTMQFLNFSLSGFTRNDQAASGDIIPLCEAGDLVIRDLGYFALETFKELIDKEVHFLSRLRFGVKIYGWGGTEIPLKSLLKRGKKVDRWVLIGVKKVPVRLVMLPVPKEVAAEKIRKAKQDRDKRLNHSQEYYKWLEFNVYVTTVDEDTWSTEDVMNAYRVRWQIEIIFKSWKTAGLNMQQLLHEECTNPDRVKTCIYLMLLFITLFCKKLYSIVLNKMIKSAEKEVISIIKMFAWVWENLIEVLAMSNRKFTKMAFEKCCYEKRNTRENMVLTILKCKS